MQTPQNATAPADGQSGKQVHPSAMNLMVDGAREHAGTQKDPGTQAQHLRATKDTQSFSAHLMSAGSGEESGEGEGIRNEEQPPHSSRGGDECELIAIF